ncbi:hypothetical protein D3C72_1717710 [compost metagenome]
MPAASRVCLSRRGQSSQPTVVPDWRDQGNGVRADPGRPARRDSAEDGRPVAPRRQGRGRLSLPGDQQQLAPDLAKGDRPVVVPRLPRPQRTAPDQRGRGSRTGGESQGSCQPRQSVRGGRLGSVGAWCAGGVPRAPSRPSRLSPDDDDERVHWHGRRFRRLRPQRLCADPQGNSADGEGPAEADGRANPDHRRSH